MKIHKLDNSDWVKDGVNYLQQTENICPFCQQSISKDLREQIESFFDETYENKKKELAVIGRDIPILDFKELKAKIELLKNTYKNNLSELEKDNNSTFENIKTEKNLL
ncbi:AAA family ATPase [Lebetimonas sp. JS032]|uniref:AAA family ATPase n=1 Tax=Lebetimonas sp. JS032 TaxID=990070 RepID=UPI0004659BD8|nr:AAA family ATPase [Lebetimonas sp. JS032]